LVEPKPLRQFYRATSEELMRYVTENICDDEDRVHDYWLRDPPPEFKRLPPDPFGRKATQDASGYLTSGWEHNSARPKKAQDSKQDAKFVSN
jgi:hypothetical protein